MKTFNQVKPCYEFAVGDIVCKRTHKGLFLAIVTEIDPPTTFGHQGVATIKVLRDDMIPERVGQSWSHEIPTLKAVTSPTSELAETQDCLCR